MKEQERIYKIRDVSGNNNDCYYNCLTEIFNNKENHKLIKDSYLNELKKIFRNPDTIKENIKLIINNNSFVHYFENIFLPYVNIYLENYNKTNNDDVYIKIFSKDDVFNNEGYKIILEIINKYKNSILNKKYIFIEKDKEIIVKNILIELCSRENVMVTQYIVSIINDILAKYDIYVINMQTTYSKNESGEIVKLDLYNDIIKNKYINKFYTLDNNNDLDKKYIDHIINTTYDSLTSINYNIKNVEEIKYIVTFNNNIHYNYLYIDNNSIFKIFDIKRFKNKQEENIKKEEKNIEIELKRLEAQRLKEKEDIARGLKESDELNERLKAQRLQEENEENEIALRQVEEFKKEEEAQRLQEENEENKIVLRQVEKFKKKEEAQRQKKSDINFTIIANGGYNNKYIDNNCSKYNRKIYNKDGKEYVIYKYQKILLQKYKQKIQEIKKKEKVSSSKSITSAKKKEKVSSPKNK